MVKISEILLEGNSIKVFLLCFRIQGLQQGTAFGSACLPWDRGGGYAGRKLLPAGKSFSCSGQYKGSN